MNVCATSLYLVNKLVTQSIPKASVPIPINIYVK